LICEPAPAALCALSLHDALPISRENLLHEVRSEVTEERVALDDVVDLAVDEGLHAVLDRVDRDDLDVDARLATGGLDRLDGAQTDRKSTRLNSSHVKISYAVLCL